jgi:hypothetical protein
MKKLILFCLAFYPLIIYAQANKLKQSSINLRFSFLLLPAFSPLLTIETRTIAKFTLQVETNFKNIHGINFKYFLKEEMNEHYVFIGTASIASKYLRKDEAFTFLPYLGYGYAYRFGKNNAWIMDSRLGIGQTINADKNIFSPILKTGIGWTF